MMGLNPEMPSTVEPLGDEELHLWLFRPGAVSPEHLFDLADPLLSADERARYHRFLVPSPKHTFLAARLLARSILSCYTGVPAKRLEFRPNSYGRPELVEAPQRTLEFNLSHKNTLVALLVSRRGMIGVDVEDRTQPPAELLSIAESFFSAEEFAALSALPEPQRPDRFFDYWTLKEAYIKARGVGLGLGLSDFYFELPGSHGRVEITVRFKPGFRDDTAGWQFAQFRPDSRHQISLAAERISSDLLGIRLFDATEMLLR